MFLHTGVQMEFDTAAELAALQAQTAVYARSATVPPASTAIPANC